MTEQDDTTAHNITDSINILTDVPHKPVLKVEYSHKDINLPNNVTQGKNYACNQATKIKIKIKLNDKLKNIKQFTIHSPKNRLH